jgi:hypothetical protein
LRKELIEVELVETLYDILIKYCNEMGLLPASVKSNDVVVFYSEAEKSGSHMNYEELYILPNGSLFMSEVNLIPLIILI